MPTNFNIFTTNVEELEMELEEAKKEAQKYTDFVELLQQQLETAKRNVQFKSAHPETEVVTVPMHITDILDVPMHITDVLDVPVPPGSGKRARLRL